MKDWLYSILIVVSWLTYPLQGWLWDGPPAYVPGIAGLWHHAPAVIGVVPDTHQYAQLAAAPVAAGLRGLCFGLALLALTAALFTRRLGELRLPVTLLRGVYALTLVTVCGAFYALRARPVPADYATGLPARATLALQRASSAPASEVVTPDLTLHYECRYETCSVRAGRGCAAYANGSAFERLQLRRDEQRGWWVFDSGAAQLVFRDGDFACIHPAYVHVMDAVRPPTGSYALSFALLVLATLLLSPAADRSARRARAPAFALVLACSWALYPMLPALLTAWS